MRRRGTTNLDDIRRACGSAWARARAASASTARPGSSTASTGSTARRPPSRCAHFLQERWKGVYPILYGDQLRQARLDDWIFQGLLDVEHLPARGARSRAEVSHHDVDRRRHAGSRG